MTIKYQSEFREKLLIVTASGRDDTLEQVIEYGCSVIALAVESGATRLLCDERGLEYTLDTVDTYKLAKTMAERAPKIIRVAIVCRPEFLVEGKFWETVAANRALLVRVDTDFDRALRWLDEGASPSGGSA